MQVDAAPCCSTRSTLWDLKVYGQVTLSKRTVPFDMIQSLLLSRLRTCGSMVIRLTWRLDLAHASDVTCRCTGRAVVGVSERAGCKARVLYRKAERWILSFGIAKLY